MTKPHYEFLKKNQVHLGPTKTPKEIVQYFYHIYNEITGEAKAISGCGRCVLNVKKRLKIEIENYEKL